MKTTNFRKKVLIIRAKKLIKRASYLLDEAYNAHIKATEKKAA